jgi:hypothetical protein
MPTASNDFAPLEAMGLAPTDPYVAGWQPDESQQLLSSKLSTDLIGKYWHDPHL